MTTPRANVLDQLLNVVASMSVTEAVDTLFPEDVPDAAFDEVEDYGATLDELRDMLIDYAEEIDNDPMLDAFRAHLIARYEIPAEMI